MYKVHTRLYLYIVHTSMYLYIDTFHRCLGLFGDHIVPAVLHRYTKVLLRPDLINSKGKPLVTTARLSSVWKRLSSRFKTVVADTSMITLSNEYSIHFHALYINGKVNAKMTGDQMKMLILLVNGYIPVCTEYIPVQTGMYCVYKNISEDAVLCRMTVGNNPLCA